MSAFGGKADIAPRRRVTKYSCKMRCWEHQMGEDKHATGRCLCGNVRYQCEGNLGPAHYCHCEDCRRCTGSINVAVQVESRSFKIIAGNPRGFTKRADSGNPLTRYFCPECGAPLYTVSPVHPDVLYVKAGSLDDPHHVQPRRQNWIQSKVSWTTIDPDLPASPKNPEA